LNLAGPVARAARRSWVLISSFKLPIAMIETGAVNLNALTQGSLTYYLEYHDASY